MRRALSMLLGWRYRDTAENRRRAVTQLPPVALRPTTPPPLPTDTEEQPLNTEADWRDMLVELHVLAEHGDRAAATEAARWLARDTTARHAWDAVQHTCDTLRSREER